MDPKASRNGWCLEVVRGRDAGLTFALGAGKIVLGNSPGEGPAIDLARQEGDAAARRMSARHALLECSKQGLAVRDLESPGGTFVNRQRILSGQARPLRAGDVIQLGGVQLKVVDAHSPAEPSPPPVPVSVPFLYTFAGGPTCRSWDDLLTASAQRWEALRGELVSGRLAAFAGSIGRGDLAPSPTAKGSPDERLDAWLGAIPTTRPARPELDVHPSRLLVRVAPGGGTTRRVIRLANVGHRLLRSTARVEPAGTSWLTLSPEFAGREILTVEETELAVEITIPAVLDAPLSAEVVIEGNGGSKRVAVVLEAKSAVSDPIGTVGEAERPTEGVTLGEWIARQSMASRVASWALVALAVRLLVGVAGGSIGEDGMIASGPSVPSLGRVALAIGAVGAILGGLLAARKGGLREAPGGAFAGGFAGVIVASALVAACQAVEPSLGSWSASVVAVCLAWALFGSALAGLSGLVVGGKS